MQEFSHASYGKCLACGHLGNLTGHPCSQILLKAIMEAARELQRHNEFGALHIFISDGNCDDEDIELCLNDDRITDAERKFAVTMLEEFTEHQRHAVWAFANCVDLGS